MRPNRGGVLDVQSEFLTAVGSEALTVLPHGWTKAWLHIERGASSAGIAVFFIGSKTPTAEQVDPPSGIALKTLALSRDAGEPWTTLTMAIESSGKFNVDYGYEPVPIEDEFERRLAWEHRYLPRP